MNRCVKRVAFVPQPMWRCAHAELAAFARFLASHEDAPVVCVAGDSATLLPLLYQQLPQALVRALSEASVSTAAATELRLVSHEVAGKGRTYAESAPDRFVVVRAAAPSKDAHPLPPHVRWCVPRILANTAHLDGLQARWDTSVARGQRGPALPAQTVLFVNTDVVEGLARGGGGPVCELLGRPVPTHHLHTRSPFLDWRTRRALAALDAGADPSTIFRSASSVRPSAVTPPLSVGGCRGGDAHPVDSSASVDPHEYLHPRVYASAVELANGARRARVRHEADAAVVEHLHALVRPSRSPATSEPVVRRYYPVVSHVDELLARQCCLSDVFVFELADDSRAAQDLPAATLCSDGDSPHAWAEAALAAATMQFHLCSGPPERRQVEQCVGEYVSALSTGRRAMWWSASDPVSCTPRVAVCFSYEVLSREAVRPLLEEERRRAASATTVPAVEELPTTMGFLVRTVTAALRARGWVLVLQDSHHTWDSVAEVVPLLLSPRCRLESVGSSDLSQRVWAGAAASHVEKQAALWRQGRGGGGAGGSPSTSAAAKGCRTSGGCRAEPGRGTSLELWQAAVVPHGEGEGCLPLWRGAHVALPSGRCGVVVGFAAAPVWATPGKDTGRRLSGGHAELMRWLSSPQRPRWRWKPSLPAYIAAGERELWPVVQFRDRERPTLVLPSRVRRHVLHYPTLCFVSAAQQWAIAAAQRARAAARPLLDLEEDWARAHVRGGARGRPVHGSYFLDTDAADVQDASWRHSPTVTEPLAAGSMGEPGYRGGVATALSLPLVVHVGETPASLFSAYVLLDSGAGMWYRRTSTPVDGAAVACQHDLQSQWHRLHTGRRAELLQDTSVGAVAPTPFPLRFGKRHLHAGGFLDRPQALRCVVTCLTRLDLVTVDSPSTLALVTRRQWV